MGWIQMPRWAVRFMPHGPAPALPGPGSAAATALAAKVERTLPLGTRARPLGTPPAPRRSDADAIQVDEPLRDADATKARGFYHEVTGLLRMELESDPARLDLHRTLLEVLRAAGDPGQYVRYAQLYYERSRGGDAHWDGIAAAGRELLPGHALFDEAPGLPKKFHRFYESVDPLRLQQALRAMSDAYEAAHADPAFERDLYKALAEGARRPTPLTPLPLTGEDRGGATVFAKREDTRAPHDDELINAIGQTLLGLRLGRRRIVSATRDGVHGLIVASVAARHGLDCTIYLTQPAHRRHFARVLQMRRLGAEVRSVPAAPQVEAAWQAALQDWLAHDEDTHYVSSLESGPHPFPLIVRDLQSIVGQEARVQLQAATGSAPGAVVAGAADGYVGLGLLHAFLGDERVALHCVEASEGVAGGAGARFLREHQWLRATRRVQYATATDEEAMQVIEALFHATGMCVALESARTLAYARRLAATLEPGRSVLTLIASPEERPLPPA